MDKKTVESAVESLTLMVETALHTNMRDILEENGWMYEILETPDQTTGAYYRTDCPDQKMILYRNQAIDQTIDDVNANRDHPFIVKRSILHMLRKLKK